MASVRLLGVGCVLLASSCGSDEIASDGASGAGAAAAGSAGHGGLSAGSGGHAGAGHAPGGRGNGDAGSAFTDAGSAGAADAGAADAGSAGAVNPGDAGAAGAEDPPGGSGGTGAAAGGSGGGAAGTGTAGAGTAGSGAGGFGGATGTTGAPLCGAAPYAHAYLAAKNLVAPSPQGPITLTPSLCAKTSLTVDPGHAKPMDVPGSTAIFLRASQTGSYPALSPEFKLMPGAPGAQILLVSVVAKTVDYSIADSNWNQGTHAAIYVTTTKQAVATGDCADVTGIKYGVVGHPEAIAVYSGTGPATSTPSTSDSVGSAQLFIKTIGTLALPELVQVVGTKAGCTLTLVDVSKQTGKLPVARGTTSGTLIAAIGN